MQCKSKQHGKQQHLQDITAGEGTNHTARNNIEQERNNTLRLCLFGVNGYRFSIQRSGVDVHARTRLDDIYDNQPEDQGNSTDDFKIEQRNRACASDRFHAFHASNAGHHGTENHRSDNHFNQFYETVSQRLHLRPQIRIKMPKQHPKGNGGEHLEIKTLKYRFFHFYGHPVVKVSPKISIRWNGAN